MEPTVAKAAEVTCHCCGTKKTGTIDQLRAKSWQWFSDATRRYFWCAECCEGESARFVSERKAARASKQAHDEGPYREAKRAARLAANGQ